MLSETQQGSVKRKNYVNFPSCLELGTLKVESVLKNKLTMVNILKSKAKALSILNSRKVAPHTTVGAL